MFTHHFGRPKHSRREPCSVREARKWRPALSGDMTCLSGKSLIADSTMSRKFNDVAENTIMRACCVSGRSE